MFFSFFSFLCKILFNSFMLFFLYIDVILSDSQTDRQTDYIVLLAVGVALRATPTPSWWGRFTPPQAPPRA